jgi:DNA ligase-1
VVFDGELYNHNLRDNFEKIISLVRKQKPTEEDKYEARIWTQYHVYDYTGIDYKSGEGVRYRKRMHNLNVSDIYTPSIRHVESKIVATPAMCKVIHQENLDKGYEGSIMRLNSTYQQKRTYSLMKFKDFQDAEAEIIGWVEGKGKRRGTIGKFVAKDVDGNEFGMPVMDKFKKLQRNFKEMQKWVGKIATFTYFERTKAKSYRHPLFKTLRNYE